MSDTEKPGSALEAVEAAASAADESAPEQEDSSSSAEQEQPQLSADAEESAIETPDEGSVSSEDNTESKGPLPFERHEAILAKARAETEAATKAYEDYKARVAWAENVNQSDVQQLQALTQELHADPIAFLRKLEREIAAHPHLGPQLKQPEQFKMPEPALVSQDGQPVWTAQQIQQIRDHDLATLRAEMSKQVTELQQGISQQAQVEQQRQALAEASQTSSAVLAEYREKPHFKDNEERIAQVYAEMSPEMQRRLGPIGSLEAAYSQVLLNEVLPAIEKSSKEKTLKNLKKKAAAATVEPGTAAGAGQAAPTNQKQIAQFLEELASS